MLLNLLILVIPFGAVLCDYLEENPNILFLGDKCEKQMTEIIDGETYTYCCIACMKIYEADEILPGSCCDDMNEPNNNENKRRLNPALENRRYYWPNGYVPYVIESTIPEQDRILQAIKHWNENTNIKLGPRINEDDYIEFKEHVSACSSYVGRRGGNQTIKVASWCKFGNIIHEIGHAIGMDHTQSREDRDEYIIVHKENIPDDKESIFNQKTVTADDCLRYDYGSIMHYSKSAYSDPDLPSDTVTLETINPPGSDIGQRDGLSTVDIACTNSNYSPCRVALFEDDNFNGQEYSPFGSDDYTIYELTALDFTDNQVSSLKIYVDANTFCSVDLHENSDKTGWSATINADNTQSEDMNIISYTRSQLEEIGFVDNAMSGLRITQISSCSVYFYSDDEQQGARYGPYSIGNYTLNHLLTKQFVDDKVTSMLIVGLQNEECVIELFQNGDFSGWKSTVLADNIDSDNFEIFRYDLSELQSNGFVNNELSSFKLYATSEMETYSEIQSNGGKCLSIDVDELYVNGGTVQTWDCNNEIQELWYYDASTQEIKNEGGKCLDVHDTDYYNKVNVALIQIWDCNGYDNQKWHYIGNQIISENGKCLDISVTDFNNNINGGLVMLYECHGGENQMWSL